MYGGLARGQGAYDMGGSAISQRASAYRSDVDNIKGANKALMKQADYSAENVRIWDATHELLQRAAPGTVVVRFAYPFRRLWEQLPDY